MLVTVYVTIPDGIRLFWFLISYSLQVNWICLSHMFCPLWHYFPRYSSTITREVSTYLFVLVMMQPIFDTHILQYLPWLSSDPCPNTVPCIKVPPYSCCTTTVDPVGKIEHFISSCIYIYMGLPADKGSMATFIIIK